VEVKIRRFREGDEERTLHFLNSVFPNWGDYHKFRWKFKEVEGALGRKAIAWVVESADEIVGHLAFIPMELRVRNQVFPVCQLVDGALNPSYRGRGVYTSLVREVLLDAERNGNAATFGFANRPAYRNYARHGGFRTICAIAKMLKLLSLKNAVSTVQLRLTVGRLATAGNDSLPNDLRSIPKRRAILTLLDLLGVVARALFSCCSRSASEVKTLNESKDIEIIALGTRLDLSWARLSSDYLFAFERNSKYLEWQYSQPEVNYKACVVERSGYVAGYVIIAWKEKSIDIGRIRLDGLKIGYIMDLVAEKGLMIPLLLRAEQELKKQKVCLVNCWTNEDTLWFNVLQNMRYCQIPKELGKVTVVAQVHDSSLETVISSENRKDMLISLGDTDHV
jgi:predicted N-acetyltransferase YhbS